MSLTLQDPSTGRSLGKSSNVAAIVGLSEGTIGVGESATSPDICGEDATSVVRDLKRISSALVGTPIGDVRTRPWNRFVQSLRPNARFVLEQALMRASAIAHDRSLDEWFPSARISPLESLLTIPRGSAYEAARLTEFGRGRGFTVYKVKCGGTSVAVDVERLVKVLSTAPDCRLHLEANGMYTEKDACLVLRELGPAAKQVVLFEQPTPTLDGMLRVQEIAGLPVCADESLGRDLLPRDLSKCGVAAINVKLPKFALDESERLVSVAQDADVAVQVSGISETQIGTSFIYSFAAGRGGLTTALDLDGPLFLRVGPGTPAWMLRAVSCGGGIEGQEFRRFNRTGAPFLIPAMGTMS